MDWWVTSSGTTLGVTGGTKVPRPNHSGIAYSFDVTSSGGLARSVRVRVDDPVYVNRVRGENGLPPLGETDLRTHAWVAAVRSADRIPEFFDVDDPADVELSYQDFDPHSGPPALPDRDLRRYIARRVYLFWKVTSFDDYFVFDQRDVLLTRVGVSGFLRNAQLLEQEGYIEIGRTHDDGFDGCAVRATARLVRDVERYGAAAADAETEADFVDRLKLAPGLELEREGILAERARYELARTQTEVASVFRALVPILEGAARRLLTELGSTRALPNLGPIIGEFNRMNVGDVGVRSLLNAVKTGRDVVLHGHHLEVAALRIHVDTCFELLLQLGPLFPETTA